MSDTQHITDAPPATCGGSLPARRRSSCATSATEPRVAGGASRDTCDDSTCQATASIADTDASRSPRYLSPPEYARRLGVRPSKVITWIRRGELRAVNTADSGRPRFRIPPSAIIEFENGRAPQPPDKPKRRRRDPQILDIIK